MMAPLRDGHAAFLFYIIVLCNLYATILQPSCNHPASKVQVACGVVGPLAMPGHGNADPILIYAGGRGFILVAVKWRRFPKLAIPHLNPPSFPRMAGLGQWLGRGPSLCPG